MNTSFQKNTEKSTNEWYTPRYIIEPLGKFDLDPATCDKAWFHEYVLNKADSLFFMRKRIKFIDEKGVEGKQPGCGSVLVAYGKENSEYLKNYPLEGKFIQL